ncbi:MAG: FliA/WhiG family RNA polymerase sigma factor [Chloroflexi bacterium]|nr:FliA/WhiG family RNA polymerase sigma factor [Chloroflexota bacterium]
MVVAGTMEDVWTEYQATKNPELLEHLVVRYAPLVKYVVGRLAISLPAILDSEDIISYGTIGLLNAANRFDPGRGVKFETFAISLIKGAIIDALRALDLVPRSVRQKSRTIERAVSELQHQYGRSASDLEVANHVGMSLASYNKTLVDASCVTLSLDAAVDYIDGDEQVPLLEALQDANSPNPAQILENAELRSALTDAINSLPQRERLVIYLYYFEELTLREISQVLDVSESRVCQLHARSVLRLRSALQDRTERK